MRAALRTIHSAFFGAVSVVQDLRRTADELRPFIGLEHEGRHGGGILAEVYHQGFSGAQFHHFAVLVGTGDNHFAVLHILFLFCLDGTGNTLPDIDLDRTKRYVLPLVNLCTVIRQDNALEFRIHFRGLEQFRRLKAHRAAGVVLLPFKDAGVLDGAGDAGLPAVCIGTQQLFAAIGIRELQYTPEGAFEPLHRVHSSVRDNLVGPPAGGYLGRKHILRPGVPVKGGRDIVGEGTLRFGIVRETGLQHLFSHQFPVQEEVVYSQAGSHPNGLGYLFSIGYRGKEPAGAGCALVIIQGGAFGNGGIQYGNPFRSLPGAVIQGLGEGSHLRGNRPSAGKQGGGENRQGQEQSVSHFLLVTSWDYKDTFFSTYNKELFREPDGNRPYRGHTRTS